jgi:Icc-related predicted phosphoesterase
MKLLIIGDLHGNMPRLHFRDFDAIVLVGDICSDKELSPIIKKWFHSLKVSKKEISFSLFFRGKFRKKKIKKMEKNSLRIGRKILEKLNSFGKPIFMVPGNWDQSYGKSKIKNQEKNDYNYIKSFWDYWLGNKINSKLVKGLKNIVDCQYKNSFFNSLKFMGYWFG